MQFVNNPDVFRHHLKIIDSLFWRERRLPDQVLKERLPCRVFIEEALLSRSFFEQMKAFVTALGEDKFYLAVIVPDPEEYFYKEFGTYPIIELGVHDTADEYMQVLQGDPSGRDLVGTIAYHAQVTLFYSDSACWGIHVDNHDLELGVAGFTDERQKNLFISICGSQYVFNAEEAIEQLLEAVFINVPGGVPGDLRDQLIKNYQIQ